MGSADCGIVYYMSQQLGNEVERQGKANKSTTHVRTCSKRWWVRIPLGRADFIFFYLSPPSWLRTLHHSEHSRAYITHAIRNTVVCSIIIRIKLYLNACDAGVAVVLATAGGQVGVVHHRQTYRTGAVLRWLGHEPHIKPCS